MSLWFLSAYRMATHAHLNVNPVPASRPRVTRWGVYYGKIYTAWMKKAKDFAVTSYTDRTLDGPLACFVEQIVAKPKTSKRDYPVGDVDNYVKAPLDALTKLERVWHDDDQIVLLVASKRFAQGDEQPRTEVSVAPI